MRRIVAGPGFALALLFGGAAIAGEAGSRGERVAAFDEFLSELPDGGFEDFSGREFPNVAGITGFMDLRYNNHPLTSGASVEVSTDGNYTDHYFVDLNYFPDNIGESRTIGKLCFRCHSPDQHWTASLCLHAVAFTRRRCHCCSSNTEWSHMGGD